MDIECELDGVSGFPFWVCGIYVGDMDLFSVLVIAYHGYCYSCRDEGNTLDVDLRVNYLLYLAFYTSPSMDRRSQRHLEGQKRA